MIVREAAAIASKCRHYAMCKIDFLGLGICPAGIENHFVSYYPQGRMDLYHALARNLIPVTKGLVHIAGTCTLCGICDKQCHFITELRPLKVMKALKEYVETYISGNNEIKEIKEDDLLKRFREIVGQRHVSNDPAVLVTYAGDPCPISQFQMPKYVIMPATKNEVQGIVSVCNQNGLPFAIRGNGNSIIGIVMSPGVIIDMNRMKGITLDKDNWRIDVGAGVSNFELQKEAQRHGLRVNTAEPAGTVCANIISSGILTTFSHAYGSGADNYVNAEFVGNTGEFFDLNEKNAPNLFAFDKKGGSSPGICTGASIRLHPTTGDEKGMMIPFSSFTDAAAFCRELSIRRIGLSIALLGNEYVSDFMAPSTALADKVKILLQDKLGIKYLVSVIGDKYAVASIKKMTGSFIDDRLFRMLMLSLPQAIGNELLDLLKEFENLGNEKPYEILCKERLAPLLETVLNPSPQNIASAVPEDLRDFYEDVYARPEMTDLVWLNTFRIISSRMGRRKQIVPFIGYVPLDKIDVVVKMNAEFKRIGDENELNNDYGFLTPVDLGKRAIFEYDYYFDQTDPVEIDRAKKAIPEVMEMIREMSNHHKGIQWINTILYQGLSRKENFLYS